MAKQRQLRRGTTAQMNAFTGAEGELTYDKTAKQLRIHDGSTRGGKIVNPDISLFVVESGQNSTGTKWYKKWSDGSIEQGGFESATGFTGYVTLLKQFTNQDSYNVQLTLVVSGNVLASVASAEYTSTRFKVEINDAGAGGTILGASWSAIGR